MGIEEKEKLLPPLELCPFCNSKAMVDWWPDYVCIKCSNTDCECQTPDLPYYKFETGDIKHMDAVIKAATMAVQKWNRRKT